MVLGKKWLPESLNTLLAGFNSDSTQNWACHDARFQTRFSEGRHFNSQGGVPIIGHLPKNRIPKGWKGLAKVFEKNSS